MKKELDNTSNSSRNVIYGVLIMLVTSGCTYAPCSKQCSAGQHGQEMRFLGVLMSECRCMNDNNAAGHSTPPTGDHRPSPSVSCTEPGGRREGTPASIYLKDDFMVEPSRTLEVGDKICNVCLGQITVYKKQRTAVNLCTGTSGHAEFKYRNSTTHPWATVSWVRPGDAVNIP